MSKHISPDSVEELVLCDVCEENLENVPVQDGIKIKKKILDEEYIQVINILFQINLAYNLIIF